MQITDRAEIVRLSPSVNCMEPASHPFEDAHFYQAWWSELACKFPLSGSQGQWVRLRKPLFKGLAHIQALRIAGWNNYYYQNFTEERFEEFLSLSRKQPWDYAELVWNAAYTDPAVFDILRHYGFSPIHVPTMPCPVIDIQDGWDTYWCSKGRSYRRDLTKKLSDAHALSPRLVFFKGAAGIDDFFERFFPLHCRYWGEKTGTSYFEDPRERAFIKRWAELLRNAGQLQLIGLEMGGELANLCMNIIFDNTLYCLLTLNTGLHLELHPGSIMMHLEIEEACRLGLGKVDMGPGDSHHKRKLSTRMEPCFTMLVPNPKSLAGQLYCRWRERQGAAEARNSS